MNVFKRGLCGLLVLTFLCLNLPQAAFCQDSRSSAKTDQKNITRHEPKIMATPEKDIPMVQAEEGKGKSGYLWVGLGAAVLLGVLAAAAGGGGGGGGDGDNGDNNGGESNTGDTGNITVGW